MCCASPEECLQKAKDDATYVVQKHIPDPLLYYNGEKCHIKCRGSMLTERKCVLQGVFALHVKRSPSCRFYNLLIGLDDGVTWRLYTYKDGYLSISPKPWSPTDLLVAYSRLGSSWHLPSSAKDCPKVKRVPSDHHSNQAHQRLAVLGKGVSEMPGSGLWHSIKEGEEQHETKVS